MGKQREASTDLSFSFNLHVVSLGSDEDGDEITSCVVVPCAAPHSNCETVTDEDVHRWIYAYWSTHHPDKPISKTGLKGQYARIKPPDAKISKPQFLAAWDSLAMKGELVRPTGGANNGQLYVLRPPKEPKF